MHPLRQVIVGLEVSSKDGALSFGSDRALDQALWLGQQTGASMYLVHSNFDGTNGTGTPSGLEDALRRCREMDIPAKLVISDLRPARALIVAALAGHGQCVVVSKRDATSKRGRRLGSVAIKVLRKCPVPVWAVRPEHDQDYKLVLVATDRSAVGDAALDWGGWIAEQYGARLHVVHALGRGGRDESEHEREAQKTQLGSELDGQISAGSFDGESVVHLSPGEPYKAIRDAGEHLHPDLLVMGSVSQGGEAGFDVGSTAERLLGRTDCSLFMLKPDDFVCPVQVDD